MDPLSLLGARGARAWVIGLLVPLASCTSATESLVTVWNGDLTATGGSTVSGTVGAVTQGGRTSASIQIRKGNPGETYGWRIETGSCGASGQIQGGAALYPDLTPDPSGSASADAGLSAVLSRGGSYAAKVFRAGAGGEEVVACGALDETG